MKLLELLEDDSRDLVIIYPGRFHPFHIGHGKVYKYLKQKYSNAKVFISTSGKTDGDRSPFTFEEKKKMMMLAGVDSSVIVQSKSPYRSPEITEMFDPDKTVVVFAVSEKDMENDPRFDFSNGVNFKQNGEPAHFQKWEGIESADTVRKHSYIATTPTFPFTIRGTEINSASKIRNMISKSDDTELSQILQDLYNKADIPQDVMDIFKRKIGNSTMNENWNEDLTSAFLIEDNTMSTSILKALTEGVKSVTTDKDDKLASLKVSEPSESSYSDKQIKMAFGILNDPRYKGGNYSGAVAAIEKLAKGLSNHPSVANALKRANESVSEDEDPFSKEGWAKYRSFKHGSATADKMAKDEDERGNKRFGKYDDKGNWHGVSTSDPDKWKELITRGYKLQEKVTEASIDDLPQKVKDWLNDYPAGEGEYAFAKGIPNTEANNKIINSIAKIVPIRKRYRAKSKPGYDRPRQYAHKDHADTIALYVKEKVEEGSYANEQHEQLEYIHHVLQECGDGNVDNAMVDQAIAFVEDIREQHFNADGSTKSESVNEGSMTKDDVKNTFDGAIKSIEKWAQVFAKDTPEQRAFADAIEDNGGYDSITTFLWDDLLTDLRKAKSDALGSELSDTISKYGESMEKKVDEWVQDQDAGNWSMWTAQERSFIQELCLRHDGIKMDPAGLKYLGKSELWDEGSILKDKGKLTTLMLWVKKNKDDIEGRFTRMFKVYSKGNNNGQSDGNQVLQNIIGKIGKVDGVTETVNEDLEEMTYVTLTGLADKLKDMHDTLQWTRDEPSRDNRGKSIDDILEEIKEVMSVLTQLNKHYNKSVDEQLSKKKKITNKTSVGMVAEDEASDLYHDNVKSGKNYNDYKGIQIHNLRKELKRVRKILLNLQDIEGKDNSSDMVNNIKGMLSGYEQVVDNMDSAFDKLEIGRHRTEEGVMATIGQGIDNVAVGAGKLAKKGAKKAAPHIKKAAKDLGKAGVDATKKGLNKLSKIGSKKTSYDVKTGKTNTTYGMANATESYQDIEGKDNSDDDQGYVAGVIADHIKDYVDDHKEHFDAYPMDVEINNKIYDWDTYWAILDKAYPDAYDNQYANESIGDADIEKMRDAYNYNEDRNAHSENILMLAHSFATRGEIKAIEGLLKITKRQGYVTPEQSEIMYNSIHKKYIGKLFPIGENRKKMHISPDIAKAKTLQHTLPKLDRERYQERDGLEGPFMTKSGKVVYYDSKEGSYYDPDTDIYLSYEEWKELGESEYLDHFDSMAAEIQKEGILHYSDAKGTPKYSEGYKAAKDGVKYDENPYRGIEKLQWSRGHNDERADRLRAAGEPNYGARGQFESEEDGVSAEDLVDIIMHRIKMNKPLMLALLGDEGPGPLMNAVEDVADFYSGTTEVGSSDVSAMVDAVKRTLFPLDYHKFDSEPYGEAYNPETGRDPNVDTTEWDELIAKAKKKQKEKKYANSKAGKRDPAYRHYHQYKTQEK